MGHPLWIRYFDGALTSVADAGHDLHVAFENPHPWLERDPLVRRLAARHSRITCGVAPLRSQVRAISSRRSRRRLHCERAEKAEKYVMPAAARLARVAARRGPRVRRSRAI
jgi:hypothetical protein